MSIQQLLQDMPLVKSSNVLLAPTKEMPVILSQRFQKNGSSFRFKMLCPTTQNDVLDFTTEPEIVTRKKKVSVASVHSTTSAEPTIKSKTTEENVERSEQTALELEYTPFKLKPTSSFNPIKLTPRHYKRLDPLTLAKYEAYSVPRSEILTKVSKSESRAKAFIAEERLRVQEKAHEAKKKWNIIHAGIEDSESKRVGELNAKKAKDRMRSKLQKLMSYRSTELASLVEGQASALEAIRLKEFLAPPPKIRLQKLFTEKDRLRLEELIGNR